MSLVAVAFCPHPPVLIPEIAAGAAGELDGLRGECDAVVGELWDGGGVDEVVVLGGGERTGWWDGGAYASFAPYGVSFESSSSIFRSASSDGAAGLPLSLAVGVWLVDRATRRPVSAAAAPAIPDGPAVATLSVASDTDQDGSVALAMRLRSRPGRTALLVMGDGSACRGERAPGHDDPRAQPYDDRIAAALAGADTAALRDLDPALSAGLLVAGRAAWQVAAHAVEGRWRGRLRYYAAPYGVAYFVASWSRP